MKKIKINVYNRASEKMVKHQLRKSNGRFTKKWPAIIFYLSAIILVLLTAFLSQHWQTVKVVETVQAQTINNAQQIVDAEKNAILDTLEQCESKGITTAIAWEDYGTGKNRASFGAYMLKVGTVQHFIPSLTDFESISLASNRQQARDLSAHIIFETPNGIKNWYNCMIKNNLLERVNFVLELQNKIKEN